MEPNVIFNFQSSIFKEISMTQKGNNGYDLEERTASFGEAIIRFCKPLARVPVASRLVDQLIRSATSIGANYMEANNASSKRDFRNKIYIVKKECQETKHWLRMMSAALPEHKQELRKFWQEAHELTLIFQSIGSKVAERSKAST